MESYSFFKCSTKGLLDLELNIEGHEHEMSKMLGLGIASWRSSL